jgi:hypothetical protein
MSDLAHIDFDRSIVTLAGRRWPIVALVCPEDDDHDDPANRTLGIGPDVYVPMENGLLVLLDYNDQDGPYHGTWDVWLHLRRCYLDGPWPNGDNPIWLPQYARLVSGRVVPDDPKMRLPGIGSWFNADPDWVSEHLDRLATFPVELGEGPEVSLIPVRRAHTEFTDWLSARRRLSSAGAA